MVHRVLANPGKSLNLTLTLIYIVYFLQFLQKNVYIVIVHSVIMLNNNTSVQKLFSSSVVKFIQKKFLKLLEKSLIKFHFQLGMRTLNWGGGQGGGNPGE